MMFIKSSRSSPHIMLAAAVSGYMLDGFDVLMLSFMLGPLSKDLGLSVTEGGSLVTWTLIGGAVGGSIFGTLADYFGRVRILSISVFIFSIFTLMCAFSFNYIDIFIYRFIAGIGLGCEFGVGVIMATEAYPPHLRARISSYVGMSWQCGVLAASLLTPLLLPYVGWRGMFIIGSLPALLSFVIRRNVDEPQEFRESRREKLTISVISNLWSGKKVAKKSFAILVMSTIQNFGYYGLIVWIPYYLVKNLGLSGVGSGIWTASSIIGMVCGVLVFGIIASKVGQKRTFLFYQMGACMMVALYSQLSTPYPLLFVGFMTGFFVNGMMGGYGALVASLYPVRMRSTAQNVLWSIGRALGGVSPVVIGYVATRASFSYALTLLAVLYIVDLLVTALLIPPDNAALSL